jgi:hypothetical protein
MAMVFKSLAAFLVVFAQSQELPPPPPPATPKALAPYLAGPECGVAVGDSVSELVLASTHLYRGIVDCRASVDTNVVGRLHDKATFECVADVFELVSAAALTSKWVLNVFGFCFDQHVKSPKCVRSGLELTSAVAETVASVSSIKIGCVDHLARDPGSRKLHALKCVVDVKKVASHSLDVLAEATTIKGRCDHSMTDCTAGIFEAIGSIAHVAEYMFAAFHDCSSKIPTNTECGENIAKLVASLADIAAHSITVRNDCTNHTDFHTPPTSISTIAGGFKTGWGTALDAKKTKTNLETLLEAATNLGDRRKYDSRDVGKAAKYGSTSTAATFTNTLLFAAVPVALALGFFGGRKSRSGKASTIRMGVDESARSHDALMSTMDTDVETDL